MNKKIVIISGGELEEEFVLSILEKEENQYVIGVDKGMEFLYSHQILPNYIVGDFDSVKKEIGDYYRNETDVPIREFNPVKDASDTEIAIRLAMTLGAGEILILGATGGPSEKRRNLWTVFFCVSVRRGSIWFQYQRGKVSIDESYTDTI